MFFFNEIVLLYYMYLCRRKQRVWSNQTLSVDLTNIGNFNNIVVRQLTVVFYFNGVKYALPVFRRDNLFLILVR